MGFLLNGNPDDTDGDYIFFGKGIERLDFQARAFDATLPYQIYAYTDEPEGSEYRGHAYIIHEGVVIGVLQGMRFQKLARKSLDHILGKVNNAGANGSNRQSNKGPEEHREVDGTSTRPTTFEKEILLEETGLLESELHPTSFFAEMGVDSMVSIAILARLKATTEIKLGASFLPDHPSVDEAWRALRVMEHHKQHSSVSVANNALLTGHAMLDKTAPIRQSNAVLMSTPCTQPLPTTLFLIADGAGSAAAYIHLPPLAPDLRVIALESPWLHDPSNFTCPFHKAATLYLAAVRAKQPHGPYLLGGWSGGGVFAYEVSRLLHQAGEAVKGLIIIDMPAPQRAVDHSQITMPTLEIIEEIGMLSGIERAESATNIDPEQALRLKNHMLSTVRCFSQLDVTPMDSEHGPEQTFVVWVEEMDVFAVAKAEAGARHGGVLATANLDAWFYPRLHDSGPNGWDDLVGGKVECWTVEGDHFSIMTMPKLS